MDKRLKKIDKWLNDLYPKMVSGLSPITNDASFRRYFRVRVDGQAYVVMDAPPDKEDSRPYLAVADALRQVGLNVPRVVAENMAEGFFLLTDLGSRLYLPELNETSAERLYGDALGALISMQAAAPVDSLPLYDRDLLHREMNLFPDWLLKVHLDISLDRHAQQSLQNCFDFLSTAALEQPRSFVHRDYHSRNLLLTDKHNPGILDFQDAVLGPVTYDLVSLLRDCYIVWPRAKVEDWVLGYYKLAVQSGVLPREISDAHFLRWFDLMGLQRHIKVAGIFARLWHRDGKPGYLADIPVTLQYIIEISADYPETAFLHDLTKREILPRLPELP